MAKQKQDRREAAKEYASELAAALPEDKRAAFLEALSSESVLDKLGDGVLRQSDYSRMAEETKTKLKEAEDAKTKFEEETTATVTKRSEITNWYQQKLAELESGGAAAGAAATPPPPPDAAQYLTKDQLSKIVAAERAAAVQSTVAWTTVAHSLGLKHLKEYDEVLDLPKLIEHAQKIGRPVDQAYESFIAPQREAKQAKAAEKHEQDLREKITAQVKDELSKSSLPYSVANVEPSSTLMGLKEGNGKSSYGVDAAVEAYNKIQLERR